MTPVILFQTSLTAIAAAFVAQATSTHHAISFVAGSLIILLSFWLLGWAWGLIFKKKLVALAIGIIVFKYAILGIIIFKIGNQYWFKPLWFAFGVASFIFAALFYAIREARRAENKASDFRSKSNSEAR